MFQQTTNIQSLQVFELNVHNSLKETTRKEINSSKNDKLPCSPVLVLYCGFSGHSLGSSCCCLGLPLHVFFFFFSLFCFFFLRQWSHLNPLAAEQKCALTKPVVHVMMTPFFKSSSILYIPRCWDSNGSLFLLVHDLSSKRLFLQFLDHITAEISL